MPSPRGEAAGVATAAIMILSGCSVNAGSSAASAFENEFANTVGVASVTAHGSNTLPFTGSVSALIVTESEQQITDYTTSHGGGTSWDTVVVDADAVRVGLSTNHNENAARLSTARDLVLTEPSVAASVAVNAQRVPGAPPDPIYQTRVLVAVAADESSSLIDGYTAGTAATQSITTKQVSDFRDADSVFAAAQRSPDFTALRFFGVRAPEVTVQTAPDSFESAPESGQPS